MFRQSILGGVFALALATAAWGELTHKWTFNDGSADDSVGGADGLLQFAGVEFGRAQLNGQNAYVNLPGETIGINTYTDATFEMWLNYVDNGAFTRVFDFGGNDPNDGNVGGNYVFYTPQAVGGFHRMEISALDDAEVRTTLFAAASPVLPTGQEHHIAAVYDDASNGGDGMMHLYVDGALASSSSLTTQDGLTTLSLADVSNEVAWLGRSLFAADPYLRGALNEVSLHNAALSAQEVGNLFSTGPEGDAGPVLTIDRDTGEMTLANPGAAAAMSRYTITSAVGGLDPSGWEPITGNKDSNGDGSFDPNDSWRLDPDPATSNLLGEIEEAGDGGQLGQVNLGQAWRRSIHEDILATFDVLDLITFQTTTIFPEIEYIGNDGQPFRRGDLNFDGAIDADDYVIFRTNNLTALPDGLDAIGSYPFGDLDGDQDNDVRDWRLFKSDFIAANGAAAFAALGSAVPEPGSLCLITLAAGLGLRLRRSRVSRSAVAPLLLVGLFAAPSQAELKHLYKFNETGGSTVADSLGGMDGALIDAGAAANSRFFFGQLDLSANPFELSNEIVEGAYVDLPSGLVSSAASTGTSGAVTFEWWATLAETRPWSRLGDFGTSDAGENTSAGGANSDYVLVTPNSVRVGGIGLEATNHPTGGPEPAAQDNNMGGDPVPFGVGVQRHVVAVYDHTDMSAGPNGTMSLYKDGIFVDSDVIDPNIDLRTFVDNNNWLGRSQWNDPLLAGSLHEFRIYDHPVSAEEIEASFAEGPEFFETIVLDVSRTNGNMRLRNATAGSSFTLDYYQIDSEDGALDPVGWNSLSDQGVDSVGAGEGQSWDESDGGMSENTLAELFLLGDTTLGPGANQHLGAAYDASQFGEGEDGDLQFQFSLTSGETLFGKVIYTDEEIPPGPGGDFNADFDGNGLVDGADFLTQQRNWETGTTLAQGDANNDGQINATDRAIWEVQFGTVGAAPDAAAVPEPNAIALTLVGLALIGGLRNRRRG